MKKTIRILTVLFALFVLTVASTSVASAYDLQLGDEDNWFLLREWWWESDSAGTGEPFYEYENTINYYDPASRTYYVFRDCDQDEYCADTFHALPGIAFKGEVPEETRTLVIGDGVDYIRNSCNDLPNLESVVLSNTLLEVTDSFNNCPKLKKITARILPGFKSDTEFSFNLYRWVEDDEGNRTRVPVSSETVYNTYYKNSFNSLAKKVTLTGYKETPFYALADYKGFTFVEVPDCVESLSATVKKGGIEVKWTAEENFCYYKLYKTDEYTSNMEDNTSGWTYIGEFTDTTVYFDEDVKCGKNYRYKVVPYYGDTYISQGYVSDGMALNSEVEYVRLSAEHTNSASVAGHECKEVTKKATTSADGSTKLVCSTCNKTVKTTVISKVTTVKLTKSSYSYTGKAISPTATVKDSKGKTLKEGTDYTLKYSEGRKYTGKYTVTLTFKGKYSGSKKLTFSIVPKTPVVEQKLTKTSIKATWAKVSGATGYKVSLYKGDKLVKSATVNSKTLTYTFGKLSSGTTYTLDVLAYKKVNGETFYSLSKALKVCTVPDTPEITKITVKKGKATVYWNNVSGESEFLIRCLYKDGTVCDFKTVKANTTSVTFNNLIEGNTYRFSVAAKKVTADATVTSAYGSEVSSKIQ